MTSLALTTPAAAQDGAIPAFKNIDSMEARAGLRDLPRARQRGMSNSYFPRIAGKRAGYLYNQLIAFRDVSGPAPGSDCDEPSGASVNAIFN